MNRLDNQENHWCLITRDYPIVDFCIWALEVDGLQVLPFDRHADGDRSLRAKGMTPEAWKSWVTRVVLLLDQRLKWHVEDLQAKVVEIEARTDRMDSEVPTIFPELASAMARIDRSAERKTLENQFIWEEQQYQRAVTSARQVFGELELPNGRATHPAEIWDGELAVKELLRNLLAHYYSTVYSEHKKLFKVAIEDEYSEGLWETLRPYHTRLDILHLYLIAYPEPVEYLVPPVSAILSVTGRPRGSKAYKEAVLRVAESLTMLNSK